MNLSNLIFHYPSGKFIEPPNYENTSGEYPTDVVHGITNPVIEIFRVSQLAKLTVLEGPEIAGTLRLKYRPKNDLQVALDVVSIFLGEKEDAAIEYPIQFHIRGDELPKPIGDYADYEAAFTISSVTPVEDPYAYDQITMPFTLRIRHGG